MHADVGNNSPLGFPTSHCNTGREIVAFLIAVNSNAYMQGTFAMSKKMRTNSQIILIQITLK